mmetsp:Transcript_48916/g.43855  ORF Transcript_48916/g.43855 Transcript_48916/m.43855 type:complete len:95 (-) Transcript_48916:84-368(-)
MSKCTKCMVATLLTIIAKTLSTTSKAEINNIKDLTVNANSEQMKGALKNDDFFEYFEAVSNAKLPLSSDNERLVRRRLQDTEQKVPYCPCCIIQ